MILIQANKLTASYHSEEVFIDVNLTIESGQNIAIVGPSGSGKSTLLKILAGILEPTAGELTLNSPDGRRPLQRGLMFQSSLLLPWLSVKQNVTLGNRYRYESDTSEASVAKLLAAVGLTEYTNRKPMHLSGGQRQRVAFARTLASRPDVLLLDEPFSALDSELRTNLRLLVKEQARRLNVPIVIVTHDEQEAVEVGDKVLRMSELTKSIAQTEVAAVDLLAA